MIIEAIADYIQAKGIATKGTNLFGELPLGKENSFGIVAAPSPEPDKAIEYYVKAVDVWGRFTEAGVGEARMQEIFDLFHRRANYTMGDYHVYLSWAAGMVDDMDRDSNQRHLYKLSLNFKYRNAS